MGKKCLVLDLDETLVHSSFTAIDTADFVVPIKIEETWHQVYVTKRPGVDEFLQRVARQYEVVVFTASLSLVRPNSVVRALLALASAYLSDPEPQTNHHHHRHHSTPTRSSTSWTCIAACGTASTASTAPSPRACTLRTWGA